MPSDYPRADELEEVRLAYRRQPWGGAASSLAQYFEGGQRLNGRGPRQEVTDGDIGEPQEALVAFT